MASDGGDQPFPGSQQITSKACHTMVKRYEQHQIGVFAIGEIVSVHIPRQDRDDTDGRCLYCLEL